MTSEIAAVATVIILVVFIAIIFLDPRILFDILRLFMPWWFP